MLNEAHRIYNKLLKHFGKQHWWPADSPLEIVVGAILVQNTNWNNVEKALNNLKKAGKLNWRGLSALKHEEMAGFFRPAGYYNIKARRLGNLLALFKKFRPWHSFFQQEAEPARQQLLAVNGIGPETADALLLYVGHKPTFVADAYTLRFLSRHNRLPAKAGYDEIRSFFMERLEPDSELFAEYHALILALAKTYCRKSVALCNQCPLREYLPSGAVNIKAGKTKNR